MFDFIFFGLSFSDSYVASYLDWFHSFNYILLLSVFLFVSFLLMFLIFNNFFFKSTKVEYQVGEFFCSFFPSLILLFQMFPSLGLLYFQGVNSSVDCLLSVKVIGHQWYWSYEYSDVLGLDFDSYMKSVDGLYLGDSRLLDVDNRCVLPVGVDIRFCVTSGDVIHSWALSSLFVKVDAMSGLLSVFSYNFPTVGLFYGQCSEICGANHSFMPIVLEVCLFSLFKSWCCLSY